MHEHYRILEIVRPILEAKGFTERSENSQTDHYGSILTIFESGEKKIKFEWSGKEGVENVMLIKAGTHTNLETKIPESNESNLERRIKNLILEIEDHL